jgi:hypothetical protein
MVFSLLEMCSEFMSMSLIKAASALRAITNDRSAIDVYGEAIDAQKWHFPNSMPLQAPPASLGYPYPAFYKSVPYTLVQAHDTVAHGQPQLRRAFRYCHTRVPCCRSSNLGVNRDCFAFGSDGKEGRQWRRSRLHWRGHLWRYRL